LKLQFYPLDPLLHPRQPRSHGCEVHELFRRSAPLWQERRERDGSRAPATITASRLAFSPELLGSLAAEWRDGFRDTASDWFVGGDASYVSERNLDSTLDPRSLQAEYTLLGLRAGFRSQRRLVESARLTGRT
jgi:outer membrane receptor protein involved in Fe transport